MILDRFEIINEEFYTEAMGPDEFDGLLSQGWRHFGTHFFRYNYGIYEGEIRHVLPLRVRLADFVLSKSQRRSLTRNADLAVTIEPTQITAEIDKLFHRHKLRFKSGTPSSIYDFVSPEPAYVPVPGMAVVVRKEDVVVAASFFDVGATTISSIYGIFDPDLPTRRLGILTMLKEIEFAKEHGKSLYYHGYAYEGESFYDYKKRFSGLEKYDWNGHWQPLTPPLTNREQSGPSDV